MEATEDTRISPCLSVQYLAIPQILDINSAQEENQDNVSMKSDDTDVNYK